MNERDRQSIIDVPRNLIPGVIEKKSAVLMLFLPEENGPTLLFIRRSEHVPSHKGQVAFPGGGYKPEDITLDQTALREAWEELGIETGKLQIIGSLPPTPTVASSFVIYPYVALPRDPAEKFVYRYDGFEVDEAFHVPLSALLDPANFRSELWTVSGHTRPVIFYTYRNTIIWGATAYILYHFLDQVRAGHWDVLFQ